MKKQIRTNVFETNSSSTHSLTICTKEEYEKWKNGEMAYDEWKNKLIPITDEIKKKMEEEYSNFLAYEQFGYPYIEETIFKQSYTTPNGEEIVAFGYYGYDS